MYELDIKSIEELAERDYDGREPHEYSDKWIRETLDMWKRNHPHLIPMIDAAGAYAIVRYRAALNDAFREEYNLDSELGVDEDPS